MRSVVAEQRIGDGRTPDVPVLVGQKALDDVIPYAQAKQLASRWCSQGTNVWFKRSVAPTHVGGAVALLPAAFGFLEARFGGDTAKSNCSSLCLVAAEAVPPDHPFARPRRGPGARAGPPRAPSDGRSIPPSTGAGRVVRIPLG